MSTPKKDQPEDILKDLENDPQEKSNSRLTNVFNFFSCLGKLAVRAKDLAVVTAVGLYNAHNNPVVNKVLYSPFAKAKTPVEKAVSVGVLAAGIGAAYSTWGLFGTTLLTNTFAAAATCKGTQFAIGFAKHYFLDKTPSQGVDVDQPKKSQADAEMGDVDAPKKPKATGQKFDPNQF
ncbi:MAG: hypothetical protein NZ828_04470 [Alphaproteobacteria bacterium]|nr:hypothetical protein [Alphaproteobacteria bacterium]